MLHICYISLDNSFDPSSVLFTGLAFFWPFQCVLFTGFACVFRPYLIATPVLTAPSRFRSENWLATTCWKGVTCSLKVLCFEKVIACILGTVSENRCSNGMQTVDGPTFWEKTTLRLTFWEKTTLRLTFWEKTTLRLTFWEKTTLRWTKFKFQVFTQWPRNGRIKLCNCAREILTFREKYNRTFIRNPEKTRKY